MKMEEVKRRREIRMAKNRNNLIIEQLEREKK